MKATLAVALLAVSALPGTAQAQYQLPTLVRSIQADSVHETAALRAADRRYRDAAHLHRRSAELRAPDDPLGFRCLVEAAAMAYALGDRSTARRDMGRAADHALARGDLRTAALALLDAAWIAQEQKNARQVWELGHRAEMLAASPLLGMTDRAAILRRIKRTADPMSRLAIRQGP